MTATDAHPSSAFPSQAAAGPAAASIGEQALPALRRVPWTHGIVGWREAGEGPALVLLHGIGSGAGSWQAQFASLAPYYRVLAWDAPGYGESTPLPDPAPLADDYADALAGSLAALGVERAIVVGHSLGALVAAAYAAAAPSRVTELVLASPARGYGKADPAVRDRVERERAGRLDALGIGGLAAARAAGLCSPDAPAEVVERVRQVMARATAGGYRQAIHLLTHDDLLTRLAGARPPRAVLCGALDSVTTPADCRALAERLAVPYVELPGLAHACYVEAPERFDAALRAALETR